MKKIAIVLGTRPEAIKLIPVYLALKNNKDIQTALVSTGQHREMLAQIFDFFDITPDIDLDVMTHNQSLASLTGLVLNKIDNYLVENPTDMIITQGDTTTCMAASLAAFYRQIPVSHVEAGLRTGNKYSPFPEEVNRKITGVIADFHFAPTGRAEQALKAEGITENVHMVGNTVIDSLLLAYNKVQKGAEKYNRQFSDLLDASDRNILITGHRRESFGEGFKNICEAIIELAGRYAAHRFIYPVHLNPNVKDVVFDKLNDLENVKLIDPLPYDELIYLMSRSRLIMSDSGGIQEEAPSLNKPVVVLRETTERPEGLEAGCSILAGTNRDNIVEKVVTIMENREVYDKMAQAPNPYGKGDSADQINKILTDHWL